MNVAKPKIPKVSTQNSTGFKQKLAIGRAIAVQLPSVMSAEEVAKVLGVSHQYVRRTELLALAKIAAKMKELYANAKHETL